MRLYPVRVDGSFFDFFVCASSQPSRDTICALSCNPAVMTELAEEITEQQKLGYTPVVGDKLQLVPLGVMKI